VIEQTHFRGTDLDKEVEGQMSTLSGG